MLNRFVSIMVVSFLETVRQPIYGVLLLATALMLMANVSLSAYTLDNDDMLLMDLGLSTLLLSGLFLASFSATSVLSREIENKTVLTVISKPVSRRAFFLAKSFGLAGALVLAHYLSTLVFLLAQRHGVMQTTRTPWDMPVLVFGFGSLFISLIVAAFVNYFYGKDFPLTVLLLVTPLLTLATVMVGFFGKEWEVIPFLSKFPGGQVILASLLVLLFNLILAALATAVSTRLGQLMTLVTCVGFVVLAVVSDYAFGQRADFTTVGGTVAGAAYHFVPNLGPFWIIDGLMAKSSRATVTGGYMLYAAAYAGLLVIGLLAAGIAMFERREVG